MINIEEIKPQIVEKLLPLKPDKIILFGSYAYGTPTEESDIDLFLVQKNLKKEDIQALQVEAGMKLFELIKKYKIGFDIFVDSETRMKERVKNIKDQFYAKILDEGEVIYGK